MKISLLLLFAFCYQTKAEESQPTWISPDKAAIIASPQQEREIKGVVKDKRGDAIIGANVIVKGTSQRATVTNLDGNFTINAPEGAVLVVSYIGYISQEIIAGRSTSLMNIVLEEDVKVLNEIVVVGYGTQKKGEITSSITSMKTADFNKAPVVNPMQLIEGRVAGLTISRASTDPNAAVGIQMRGVSSIDGSNEPLIIIDGIPGNMTSLNAIAPEDIESIDVLKDGSAAAIYGTRGNNGVVIVSTKRPQVGVSQVEYSGYLMHEGVYKRPDILSADEFVAYGKQTNSTVIKDFGARTDAYDMLLNNDNLTHVHNLTATGGTSSMNYRASLNYKKNEGIAIATKRETINSSLAVNHWSLNNKLLLAFNLSNSYIKADFIPDDDNAVFYEAIRRNPTIPIYNNDGTFYEDYGGYEDWNPVARSYQRTKQREYKNLLGSFKATYEIISDLRMSAFVAWEKNDEYRNGFYSRNEYTSIKDGSNGRVEKEYLKWANRTFEWTANYNTSIGGIHNITGLLGYSYQDFDYEQMRMTNWGFLTDAFTTHNIEAGSYLKAGRAEMASDKTLSTLIAFFARANYNYNGKYLLAASLRREGSSKFGANNKWALFPSANLGWMLSKESFMESIPAINMLKFRAGFGVTGSLPNDPYMSLIKYGTGAGNWDAINGGWIAATYGPGNNPNPDLKWEKNQSLNIGFDFGILNDRINGTFDWYQRTTSDLIGSYTAQQPPLIYNTITTNVGSIRNRGVELALNLKVVDTQDFSYTANLTFAYEKNMLTSLSNDMYKSSYINKYSLPSPGNIGYAQRLMEGQPVGSFFGYVCDGIDSDGNWILKDLDGVPGLSEDDRTFIGNGLPKIKAGLQNTFLFKNFDFSFFLRGMFDYDILNEGRIYFGTTSSIDKSGTNVYKYALEEKLKEDPRFSTYYLEKGDFLKIDNVTLGYTFKTNNKYVRSLRAYGNITNLATITGYKGLTPDINVVGIDSPGIDRRGVYPITRTFTFGVNVGF
ncbi:MAG: TonB-dependent receptor [Mediterranea sp.]|jgi:TonB-linked SusC/RagA family outer membrane protein|nr:TonB-dependent receptor [Mediterranea sp.]